MLFVLTWSVFQLFSVDAQTTSAQISVPQKSYALGDTLLAGHAIWNWAVPTEVRDSHVFNILRRSVGGRAHYRRLSLANATSQNLFNSSTTAASRNGTFDFATSVKIATAAGVETVFGGSAISGSSSDTSSSASAVSSTTLDAAAYQTLLRYTSFCATAYTASCNNPQGSVLVQNFGQATGVDSGSLLSSYSGYVARDDARQELVIVRTCHQDRSYLTSNRRFAVIRVWNCFPRHSQCNQHRLLLMCLGRHTLTTRQQVPRSIVTFWHTTIAYPASSCRSFRRR